MLDVNDYEDGVRDASRQKEEIASLKNAVAALGKDVSFLREKFTTLLEMMDRRGDVPSARLSKWRFHASLPTAIENLYPAETNGADWWRWVGPAPAVRFKLNLDRSQQLTIRVHVLSFILPELHDTFRLLVNGVHHRWIDATPGGRFEALLDIDMGLQGTPTEMTLEVAHSSPPVNGTDFPHEATDNRLLSFTLSSIDIEPLN
ncbi:hypothetical protein [Nitrosomonas sp. Nm33]|uniref:hypothetical protein n=1 Tax=Nitrosomonas sp. Nm33 TaxID=133724 RepID=UPI00089A1364|nr:hypothetical protein [Nitrosomonas sp. Nm33]SDY21291.1 hypothetical protein SAMN05421755_101161 [Nitrosomonas sp. Nm33]